MILEIESEEYLQKIAIQAELDITSNAYELLRNLIAKLNVAFTRTHNLQDILLAVLVGVTSGDGLGFNRACFLKANMSNNSLQGVCGLGPADHQEAIQIWNEINTNQMTLFDILDSLKDEFYSSSHPCTELAKSINISLKDRDHVLVQALTKPKVVLLDEGHDNKGAKELLQFLGVEQAVIAPLFGDKDEPFGVIIADNFVSQHPITLEILQILELFVHFASLALNKAVTLSVLEERLRELKELNKELEATKHLLAKAEKQAALGQMADQLVHSIRNPVTTIGGTARFLSAKLEDKDLKNKAQILVKECQRLENVLSRMEDFSFDAILNKESVDIAQLLKRSLALFKSDIDSCGIKVATILPQSELIVRADRLKLQEAMINVLKNSIEAMPEGGLLNISLVARKADIEIKIADTGIGMARAHLHRADQPFFTTKSQSMGLGLSIAKRTIEKHGGSLSLARNKVGGTVVTITLPIQTA